MKLAEARCLWTVLLVAAALVVPAAHGLWLDLPKSGQKCLSEEMRDNVVVLADYYAFIGETYDYNSTIVPTISIKVLSPFGNVLHHQEKITHGQFGFTTTESGSYTACFWVDGDGHNGKSVSVGVDWKTGIAAKDWDSVAKKEKIEGLELELRKLEAGVEAIHQNLNTLMYRELEMRAVSETTNARVAWWSVMSLGICVMVSFLQILYLRSYFQKKKLI
ncbi:hypothetical protein BUALT_Bualt08G0121200 [Buddleja alternifolia]|uniref:GOLD domain-containing protein n=1 Tax=Buddleja alternifolia TaxID=168488 RepID=A0AAV6X557_9LAMI|nr:hypothetical protein BUALT_Bualt08G0121200 [Buddleja alternifolia]